MISADVVGLVLDRWQGVATRPRALYRERARLPCSYNTIGIYPANRLPILWCLSLARVRTHAPFPLIYRNGSGDGCELMCLLFINHQSAGIMFLSTDTKAKGSVVDIHTLLRHDKTIQLYDFFCRRLRKMANTDGAVNNPCALFLLVVFPYRSPICYVDNWMM